MVWNMIKVICAMLFFGFVIFLARFSPLAMITSKGQVMSLSILLLNLKARFESLAAEYEQQQEQKETQ